MPVRTRHALRGGVADEDIHGCPRAPAARGGPLLSGRSAVALAARLPAGQAHHHRDAAEPPQRRSSTTSSIPGMSRWSSADRAIAGRSRRSWRCAATPTAIRATAYRYSNTNYVLLGVIVRKVTGKSPAANIRARFLKPLGLDETFMQGQEPIGRVAAKGYWATSRGYVGFSDGTRYRPHTSAATVAESAGALLSSVRDISDWQDALLSGDVLEPGSLARMTDLHPRSGYGLGMRRAWLAGRPGIGHGGSLRGFVSIMYRLPTEDIDVTILTNLGPLQPPGPGRQPHSSDAEVPRNPAARIRAWSPQGRAPSAERGWQRPRSPRRGGTGDSEGSRRARVPRPRSFLGVERRRAIARSSAERGWQRPRSFLGVERRRAIARVGEGRSSVS